MIQDRFEIYEMFQAAIDAALDQNMTEAQIREEFEHALNSAMDPE